MAAGTSPAQHSKSLKPILLLSVFPFKNTKLFSYLILTLICVFFYFLGSWKNGTTVTAANNSIDLPCFSVPENATATATSAAADPPLDFSTHHVAEELTYSEHRKKTYPPCHVSYSEYTPCEDPKRSIKFKRRRLIFRERHCPEKSELLKCRIPAPTGYKSPFRWPESRDLVWYANVPHKELTVEKARQNWIRYEGERFRFPGGGTMFAHGADAYIDDIGKLINLRDGSIRTAIDTGCGVASWGAYLLSRNIITMSFAPRDTHEAQVQFALERGVPAMIGVMASKRLPYPSRAFDMAHCSRCLIPWDQFHGLYLIEVDRVLRPGGYWIISGPPIRWKKYWKGWNRTQEDLNGEQTRIEKIAKSLCWKKLMEMNDIAIWQKPINHIHCTPQNPLKFCTSSNNTTDNAWYTDMETCATKLPQVPNNREIAGGGLAKWPERLNVVPPRISRGSVDGVTADTFRDDSELWKKRLSYYKKKNKQLLGQAHRYRNILDMNAYLGGFAAALVDDPAWVMNVVPVEAKVNSLGVIYERGLIGTYQNWCEAMSTYPRTYDFIHAHSIFSLYQNKCEMEDILLEMDRILRPEGVVVIRDDVGVLLKIKKLTEALNWEGQIVDHEDGPLNREKLLFAVKLYWMRELGSLSLDLNTHTQIT